jgi:DNA invertase Pin-like site-specific DNA recombinase
MAGLESARARGRRGGRPKALDDDKAELARRLKAEGDLSVGEICSMLGVGRSTLYRYLSRDGDDRGDTDSPAPKEGEA